jgi:hypothetical protein
MCIILEVRRELIYIELGGVLERRPRRFLSRDSVFPVE